MPLDIFDLRAVRHKIEATENVAETLAGSDGILLNNGSVQIQTDNIQLNRDKPDGGARPNVPVRRRGLITGEIELIGGATAGSAGPLSGLLRNCGHTETEVSGPPANVTYEPVLNNFPSATIGFNHAGELVTLVGARGRLTSIALGINDFAKANVEFLGRISAVAEQAVPADDLSAYLDPPAFTEANMVVSLDSTNLEGISLNLDPGITLSLAYHSEAVIARQTVRAVTGTLRVYRPLIATKDIRSLAETTTKVPLLVSLDTGTANQSTALSAAGIQIGEPQNVNVDGLRAWDIPVTLIEDYTITFGDTA